MNSLNKNLILLITNYLPSIERIRVFCLNRKLRLLSKLNFSMLKYMLQNKSSLTKNISRFNSISAFDLERNVSLEIDYDIDEMLEGLDLSEMTDEDIDNIINDKLINKRFSLLYFIIQIEIELTGNNIISIEDLNEYTINLIHMLDNNKCIYTIKEGGLQEVKDCIWNIDARFDNNNNILQLMKERKTLFFYDFNIDSYAKHSDCFRIFLLLS